MTERWGETLARAVSQRIAVATATTATLTAIPASERVNGQVAVTLGDLRMWIFSAGSSTGASADVLVPDAGSGRWHAVAATGDLASISNGEGASLVGVEDAGEYFTGADVETALAELGAAKIKVLSAVVDHADLTASATTETESLGSALPDNTRIVGVNIKLGTPFAGITGPVTVDIGTSGDVDAIVDGADLTDPAVDGQASTMPLGIAPFKHFATGPQMIATFDSASGNLVDCSAGEATIEIYYIELA